MESTPRGAGPEELPRELQAFIRPLHKTALGLSTGVAVGAVLLLVTWVHLLRSPDSPYPLSLLGDNYLPGYAVSFGGSLVGGLWGFWVGFFLGWFCAFLRNLFVGTILFFVRAKAELSESRDILDHI